VCVCVVDVAGLSNTPMLEQLSERYWSVCRDLTDHLHPHRPKRFSDIITCLSEIRHTSGVYMCSFGEKLQMRANEHEKMIFFLQLHSRKKKVWCQYEYIFIKQTTIFDQFKIFRMLKNIYIFQINTAFELYIHQRILKSWFLQKCQAALFPTLIILKKGFLHSKSAY